jgi:hypothetical protein
MMLVRVLVLAGKATLCMGLASVSWQGILEGVARWRYRKFRGPKPLPLLGNIGAVMEKGLPEMMLEMEANHGPISVMWFGSKPWLLLTDAEYIRSASFKFLDRMEWPGMALLQGISGDVDKYGILFAKADIWKPAR